MPQTLQAIFENGVLRPLEPLALGERQQVTVTISDRPEMADWHDAEFLRYLAAEADPSVTLEEVRSVLAKIPGSMIDDFAANGMTGTPSAIPATMDGRRTRHECY